MDRGGRCVTGPGRPEPDDLAAEVRIPGAAAGQRRPEPEPDGSKEGLHRHVRVVDRDFQDGQSRRFPRSRRALVRSPLGGRRVVLDEERRSIRAQAARRGQAPADDRAVGSPTFAGDRFAEVGARGSKRGDVVVDGVGRDRPGRETSAAIEGAKRRRADPGARRQVAVEHADQFQVGVGEPDQAIERAERLVTSTAAGGEPEMCLDLVRGVVRVGDGDDEVVDGAKHGRSVPGRSPRAPRYDGAVSQGLRLERSGPGDAVARVTLSRPEVHNAFDASLIGELRTTFATLAREGPTQLRAVVLAGDGPSFCAGADLAWMRAAMTLDTEGNEQDAMAMADMFETIDTCPVPVIARVHGAALGGGMGLCAVADIVIAESGTRFGFTETRLGILPAVISPFVIAKIGESHARALFPGGRRFDATRAARIGLVHEIVEGSTALDAAVHGAVADVLASGPTATRAAKAIVREVRGLGHGSLKWHTARIIARQRTSEEAQEGFRAFIEKRQPAWAPDPDEG
jgi:methylglutaconyl-CoA hydratase